MNPLSRSSRAYRLDCVARCKCKSKTYLVYLLFLLLLIRMYFILAPTRSSKRSAILDHELPPLPFPRLSYRFRARRHSQLIRIWHKENIAWFRERVARSLVPDAQLLFCDRVSPLRAAAWKRISVAFRLTRHPIAYENLSCEGATKLRHARECGCSINIYTYKRMYE